MKAQNHVWQERQRHHRLSIGTFLALIGLLVLPLLAGAKLSQLLDFRLIAGYSLVISACTFWLYWRDKQSARAIDWKTSESTLHLVELLGGWPAAFLAQRAFRHKIRKTRYQIGFWCIVVLHQAASLDFLHDWRCVRSVLGLIAS